LKFLFTPANSHQPNIPLAVKPVNVTYGAVFRKSKTLPTRQAERVFMWQEWRGSNPQPPVLETGALPIELHS
jgi:hypothetical protein